MTAAIDIGRVLLPADFARPFSFYGEHLDALLSLDVPLVVYGDPDMPVPASPAARQVVPTDHISLERFRHFNLVQSIRSNPAWRDGAPWLAASPQAGLAHYNPLVMSKLDWLARVASENPFGTNNFVWIDAGITHTVPLELIRAALAGTALKKHLTRFLVLTYPYAANHEVHGFDHGEMARLSGVSRIEWVARGGFFGGDAGYIREAARLYDAMLEHTLSAGLMGTEENVLTILAHLHPGLFERYCLESDGLVKPFFADMASGGGTR
ncbi:hypothetical protein ACKTEK_05025 [Tepidamorphus sp. 3E244]|uniref:hypothetical protein n=1 Tax=Tepidamorphus sp. 3E244 TaxID=3385498 RepID=UPI0038FC90DE